jgi:hypothetical protein
VDCGICSGQTPQAEACATKTNSGEFMNTISSHTIGHYVQLAGLGAFIAGVALSLHHSGPEICFIAGAVAFFIGKKMSAS